MSVVAIAATGVSLVLTLPVAGLLFFPEPPVFVGSAFAGSTLAGFSVSIFLVVSTFGGSAFAVSTLAG